jgi:TolB-like protein
MLLLALGLPVTVTFAWYHGERASRRISGPELTIIAILLAIGSLFFYVLVRPSEEVAGRTPGVQQAGVTAARSAATDPHGAISLAVLPFVNLSSDQEQEFFSDGITEEITAALAKVPDLRVVARTSAFEFKGKNVNIKTMGEELGATHLIEGSVRKAGNRLRITAQLIKADDGTHIWAEDYDRELTDIFAVQEDIARAITTSLRMPLGLKPGENLVNERPTEAAHESYLRAKGLVRQRSSKSVADAIAILNDVVAREPNYSSAWGLLGLAYHFQLLFHPAVLRAAVEEARPIVETNMAKAQAAAERSIKLDPKNVDGYVALGELHLDVGDKVSSADFFQRALDQDPDNPDALHGYSSVLGDAGLLKQALSMRDHLQAVEPFVPSFQVITMRFQFASGQTEVAIASLEKLKPNFLDAQLYALRGRYGEAADILAHSPSFGPSFQPILEAAVRLLRAAPAPAPKNEHPELGVFDWIYFYVGAPERFLNIYEAGVKMGYQPGFLRGYEWVPAYAEVRKTQRFKAYARDSGMVVFWKKYGWPDLCHPTTGDDFECS